MSIETSLQGRTATPAASLALGIRDLKERSHCPLLPFASWTRVKEHNDQIRHLCTHQHL